MTSLLLYTVTLSTLALVGVTGAVGGKFCFRKYSATRDACKGQLEEGRLVESDVIDCCTHYSRGGYAAQIKRAADSRSSKKWFQCTPCSSTLSKQKSDFSSKSIQLLNKHKTNDILSRHGKKSRDKATSGPGATPDVWSAWSEWGPCSGICQDGVAQRSRFCLSATGLCPVGDDLQERQCRPNDTSHCPVAGGWGDWTNWTECDVTCDTGQQYRHRICDNPPPSHGGQPCVGPSMDTQLCRNEPCPVNGNWSTWSSWTSQCSVTCGHGVVTRTRQCNNPAQQFGGLPCDGDSVDTKTCQHNTPCPVNGNWSEWSHLDACTGKPCSGQPGFRIRFRSCTNPRPLYGGLPCRGRSWKRVICYNNEFCTESVVGGWCVWSNWSPCHQYQTRSRTCQCPPPVNTTNCLGAYLETRACADVTPTPAGVQVQHAANSKENKAAAAASRCHGDGEASGDGSDTECDTEELDSHEEADADSDGSGKSSNQ